VTDAAWDLELEQCLVQACASVAPHVVRTPLERAPRLGERVWIKRETDQHTGSFKVRGALAALTAHRDDVRRRGAVAASAGNHGLGMAYAARALGLPVRIYVPASAARVKVEGIRALGAEVLEVDGVGYDGAEDAALRDAAATGARFVSPYDDPRVACGNGGTIGLEILDALPACAAIVTPVGGGGLLLGLDTARRARRSALRLIGVQSEVSPVMLLSLARGSAIERFEPEGPTLAEGLEGGVARATFEHVQALRAMTLFTVSEREIAGAMRFSREALGVVVEGSAAVAVAFARAHARHFDGETVVVLTGRNVDDDALGT
jgi:threonine dehydratase